MFPKILIVGLISLLFFYSVSAQEVILSSEKEEYLRRILTEQVVQDLKNLSEKQDYDLAPDNKSIAACLDWSYASLKEPAHVTRWSFTWEYDDSADAVAVAKENCDIGLRKHVARYRKEWQSDYEPKCSCKTVLSNKIESIEIPKPVVESVFRRLIPKSEIPTLCAEWLGEGNLKLPSTYLVESKSYCGEYEGFRIGLLDFPLMRVLESDLNKEDVPEIYPGLPKVEELGSSAVYVDQRLLKFNRPSRLGSVQTALAPPKGWGYRFRLHRVPQSSIQSFKKMLEGLESSKFFDKLEIVPSDVTMPPAAFHHALARYVRVFDLSQISLDAFSRSLWPEETSSLLEGERSTNLWAVISIPVDENWIPIGAPLIELEPIALETTSSLYLYSIEMDSNFRRRNSMGGNLGRKYEGVLDFSQCIETDDCSKRITSKLKSELIDAFSDDPISATLTSNPRPPGQLQFRRLYEKSNILDGFSGPWYEITTYNVTIWDGPSRNYGGRNPFKKNKPGDYDGINSLVKTHLHVEMSLQLGIGKLGAYPEPTREQYTRYENILDKAISTAVKRTTDYFSGTMKGNTGFIQETRKQ